MLSNSTPLNRYKSVSPYWPDHIPDENTDKYDLLFSENF